MKKLLNNSYSSPPQHKLLFWSKQRFSVPNLFLSLQVTRKTLSIVKHEYEGSEERNSVAQR